MIIKILQLERTISDGIVTTIHYYIEQKSDRNTVSTYGTVTLSEPKDDFIPFDELTQEDVIGWLDENLNLEEVESNLNARLHELDNPTIAIGIPWQSDEAE